MRNKEKNLKYLYWKRLIDDSDSASSLPKMALEPSLGIDTAEYIFPETKKALELSRKMDLEPSLDIDTAEYICPETKKALELSRRDYCLRNISNIENHMQVIRNQRESSGRADDMKATMNELQERKEMLEELLHPKLEWNCSQCTYLNSPAHFECKMCNSLKPAEITVEMSAKLQAALSNREDDE